MLDQMGLQDSVARLVEMVALEERAFPVILVHQELMEKLEHQELTEKKDNLDWTVLLPLVLQLVHL
jgi:hypothetical protein